MGQAGRSPPASAAVSRWGEPVATRESGNNAASLGRIIAQTGDSFTVCFRAYGRPGSRLRATASARYKPPVLASQALTLALISTRRVYDQLASIYLPIAAGVFGLFTVAILLAVMRYRTPDRPSQRAEANVLEGSYATLLACVAGFLIYLTLHDEHKIDTTANHERPSLVVDVTAAKWEWEFRYPRYGIAARSGVVGFQPLVVPEDRAIRFNLRSQDVIHAIWIPQLEFKRDLIHGTTEHVTLTFTHTGWFGGQCAEFCGLHHAEMVFRVHVLTPSAFTTWATTHRGLT
jgi:cytochrome c oxidase subunit II